MTVFYVNLFLCTDIKGQKEQRHFLLIYLVKGFTTKIKRINLFLSNVTIVLILFAFQLLKVRTIISHQCFAGYYSDATVLTLNWWNTESMHCVKSVRIRSFSGPYWFQMRESMGQKNSKYGHFSLSANGNIRLKWVMFWRKLVTLSVKNFVGKKFRR